MSFPQFFFLSLKFIFLSSLYKIFGQLISLYLFIEDLFTHFVDERFLFGHLIKLKDSLLVFCKVFNFFFHLKIVVEFLLFLSICRVRIFLSSKLLKFEELFLLLNEFLLLFYKLNLKLYLLFLSCYIKSSLI